MGWEEVGDQEWSKDFDGVKWEISWDETDVEVISSTIRYFVEYGTEDGSEGSILEFDSEYYLEPEQILARVEKEIRAYNPRRRRKNPSLGAEIKGIRRRRAKREAKEAVTEAKVATEIRSKRVRRTLASLNPSSPPIDHESAEEQGDARWNEFEEFYDRFSVSGDCKDLVDAYTAARMSELHYRHAKIRHNDEGRGYGPAAAEAVGLLRQIKEVCKK